MKKGEMAGELARRTGLTKGDCLCAIDAVSQIITEALSRGEKVSISGFGVFEMKVRAPRTGRNPGANTPVQIPARQSPVFHAGKWLKEATQREVSNE
jgi:DNA-binding protein HU-beta